MKNIAMLKEYFPAEFAPYRGIFRYLPAEFAPYRGIFRYLPAEFAPLQRKLVQYIPQIVKLTVKQQEAKKS